MTTSSKTAEDRKGQETVPDFGRLFPLPPAGTEDDGAWTLTPRTALALHAALEVLADHATGAYLDDDGEGFTRRLPRRARRSADREWRGWFADSALDLAGDLAAGRLPLPRCTAEELALHFGLEDARIWLNDLGEQDSAAALPSHPDDYCWDLLSEVLFQDHDVLMLYDRRLAKVVSGGHMDPESWFDWFGNMPPREEDA